jgi:hypothetical protein
MPKFVSWYLRDSYPLIREIMDDKDTLPVDFDEWEKTAESERARAKREGVVITVFLDPDEFITFCNEQKISPNSAARAKFVMSRGAANASLGI